MLLVRSIYHQFVEYDSKHILGYEYEWYSIYLYSSSIVKIGQNQGKYTS